MHGLWMGNYTLVFLMRLWKKTVKMLLFSLIAKIVKLIQYHVRVSKYYIVNNIFNRTFKTDPTLV